MQRFLGDSPIRVIVKLLLLSLLAGWVMNWLDVTPLDLIDRAVLVVENVWNLGLDGLGRFGGTVALGAMVVVPLFLLNRLANYRRG